MSGTDVNKNSVAIAILVEQGEQPGPEPSGRERGQGRLLQAWDAQEQQGAQQVLGRPRAFGPMQMMTTMPAAVWKRVSMKHQCTSLPHRFK